MEPCAKVMAEHTACFQEWLPRFVHGEVRESGCTAEYEAQQACVLEQLRAVGLGRLVTEWRPLQLDGDEPNEGGSSQAEERIQTR